MFRAIGITWIALILAGCLPAPYLTPTLIQPTETATLTPLPSATIIWFPATPTFTPFPTREVVPTEELRPGLGEIVLEDGFTDNTTWMTSHSDVGNVTFGRQELTLAVSAPKASLVSWRKSLQIGDFYLEIDALPSLCLAGDTYGLLLRANSAIDYYRLLVNCNGQLRMERIKNEKVVLLQDWISSGQIFPGGMMRSRIGVWALKNELRVFINDVYQFKMLDPVWETGQIGIFARSASDTPLTVNFSRLVIYNLVQGRPIPPTSTPPAVSTPKSITPTAGP